MIKKCGLVIALMGTVLFGTFVQGSTAHASKGTNCTMTIDSKKHLGTNGNFAQASGSCNGFVRGVYVPDTKSYTVLGSINTNVKNGQKFQLSFPQTDGYVTLTVYTKSNAIKKTGAVKSSSVKVLNRTGSKDSIVISNVKKNDIVKVYSRYKNLLYTVKAKSSKVTLTNKKLSKKGGAIYVTARRGSYKESTMTKVSYKAEKKLSVKKTNAVKSSSVKVINRKGNKDTITISSVRKNDVVKVYSRYKNSLYTVKAKGSKVTLTNKKLSKKGGTIYVTVKRGNNKVSSMTKVAYKSEK